MTTTTKSKKTGSEIAEELDIRPLGRAGIRLRIVGATPLLMNRMAAKAMQTLLVGGQRKTKADRVQIKHDPMAEYRNSVQRMPGTVDINGMAGGVPTLAMPTVAIKGAMCTAALETPGMTKTGAQRLLFMPAEFVGVYGIPQLDMRIVRSADINKTPDVRTRALLPQWGAEVEIQYVVPQLSARSVTTLLCNAGLLVGVGDGRQDKGKLNFGCFRVIGQGEQDDEWDDLVANHGREAQQIALREPVYSNEETMELMEFFFAETKRRAA